jgi:hypothetical protein
VPVQTTGVTLYCEAHHEGIEAVGEIAVINPGKHDLLCGRSVSAMVSAGGSLYSVPDCTRKRVVEVHTLADEVRIHEDGRLVAVHRVLEGRGQRRIAAGHRSLPPPVNSATPRQERRSRRGLARSFSADR